jgi:hypothetical protein
MQDGKHLAQAPSHSMTLAMPVLCCTPTPNGIVLATMVALLPDQKH